jgi:hypothetical protein
VSKKGRDGDYGSDCGIDCGSEWENRTFQGRVIINLEVDQAHEDIFFKPPMIVRKQNGRNVYSVFNLTTIDRFYDEWTHLTMPGVETRIADILLSASANYVKPGTFSDATKKRKKELEKGSSFVPYEEQSSSPVLPSCFEISEEDERYLAKLGRKF